MTEFYVGGPRPVPTWEAVPAEAFTHGGTVTGRFTTTSLGEARFQREKVAVEAMRDPPGRWAYAHGDEARAKSVTKMTKAVV